MRYEIWQVPADLAQELGIILFWDEHVDKIPLQAYRRVYEGDLNVSLKDAPEELFRIFNLEHPSDYRGRSLSVGDIVRLSAGNDMITLRCRHLGWDDISELWNQQRPSPSSGGV